MEHPEVNAEEKIEKPVDKPLWNKNFFLLWQGLLVSIIGDVFYGIALGFWILEKTGSTALMGTLMAASTAPRVILSPLSGAVVDRSDRKWLLVLMDAIRGVAVLLVAAAAFGGFLEIWMVFAAGIIIGICSSFFGPAVNSSLPDIVPKAKIVKANSFFSMVYSISGIIGSPAGGFFFQLLGAPVMFLINGCSYLFSALTELFIKIPKIIREKAQSDFVSDLKEGFKFTWEFRALRYLITAAAGLNFFAEMGIILLLPLFQKFEELGPGRYGIVMGIFTAGYFIGMLITSTKNIPASSRFDLFMGSSIIFSALLTGIPFYLNLYYMGSLMLVAGAANALTNVFILSTLQLTIPQDKRGKVFGLISTFAAGLAPLAMAAGGILAEFIPIRLVISSSFLLMGLIFVPLFFEPSVKKFICFDPDKDTIDGLISTGRPAC